jgi:RNA polymerase sigma-70 factor (ECF subfamily)
LIDDAVQEIFIVVHRRLPEFAGRSSMKTWIFGIVVNVVRAFRRTMRARQTRTLDASCGGDPNEVLDWRPQPDEALTKVEAARVVDRLLESLDDDKRAVFVLAELEELPAPEIAEALSIPLNTVYSRLRLARQEFAVASARHRARDGWRFR